MSKELEALESIKSMVLFGGEIRLPYYTLNDTKYAKKVIEYKKEKLDIIEKSLKALEIIKMKNVDIPMVKTCNFVNDYNEWHSQYKEMHLAKEEYDLLKEVLL